MSKSSFWLDDETSLWIYSFSFVLSQAVRLHGVVSRDNDGLNM